MLTRCNGQQFQNVRFQRSLVPKLTNPTLINYNSHHFQRPPASTQLQLKDVHTINYTCDIRIFPHTRTHMTNRCDVPHIEVQTWRTTNWSTDVTYHTLVCRCDVPHIDLQMWRAHMTYRRDVPHIDEQTWHTTHWRTAHWLTHVTVVTYYTLTYWNFVHTWRTTNWCTYRHYGPHIDVQTRTYH